MNKSQIRTDKIKERAALDTSHRQIFLREILFNLKTYLADSDKMIAGYYPINHEVDILQALPKERSCMPVIEGNSKHLHFHKWSVGDVLEKGAHGTMQPKKSPQNIIPDIILVPLVAFDRRGYRVGYGGGYYDVTLADLRKSKRIIAIGIGYGLQEVDHVNEESFDQKLDVIITEKEIIKIKKPQ